LAAERPKENYTMESIDVFYQGEGLTEIEHIEFPKDEAFAALKIHLAKKHGWSEDIFIFMEDEDEPVDEKKHVHHCAGPAGVKVHVHRCHKVEVKVTFNGETEPHKFSPSATVNRVKRWAAEKKFGMSPEEAGEHVLQLTGSDVRPDPNTHIGTLVTTHRCEVNFDLVPNERNQG
jgi:hypothetical protein